MIEDIDYLKENSVKESYVFMVDSKNRNKKTWSHPEKYRIDFNTPFKHVYSFEILNAVVPRTQYAIDTHNNSIRLKYRDNPWTTFRVNIGDYNTVNLVDSLNNSFRDAGYDLTLQNASSPAYLSSTFEFVSPHDFELDMKSSSMNTVLGFDLLNQKEAGKYKHLSQHLDYITRETNGNLEYHSYITNMVGDDMLNVDNYIDSWFGSVGVGIADDKRVFICKEEKTSIGDTYTLPVNKVLYQPFSFDDDTEYESGYIESIFVQINGISSANAFSWEIRQYNGDVVGESVAGSNGDYNSKAISNMNKYVLIISDGINDEGEMRALTFDTNHFDTTTDNAYIINGDGTKDDVTDSSNAKFQICFSVSLYKKLNKVIAPGMYSLLGERYVVLRCPEIETHLFRSLSYDKFTMGLAKFDLHVQGYDENRLDFTSLPPREFHPIGKLQSLTFEFQNPDGSLYNFRGINHTMTIVIRYHTPKQLKKFEKSDMNPEYDPDIFRYIQNKGFNTDSETESEESDTDDI